MALAAAYKKGKAFLTPSGSSDSLSLSNGSLTKAPEGTLFPKVDPAIDGEDCDHDCESCEIQLPKGWKIDEKEELYGHVNGWATHMLVATGKTDWVRDVSDEKGSVMEAVRDCKVEPSNGVSCPIFPPGKNLSITLTHDPPRSPQKLMLSASNMPLPPSHSSSSSLPPKDQPTTVLLLPSFTYINNVTPSTVPDLITHHISPAPTTTTPLDHAKQPPSTATNQTPLPTPSLSLPTRPYPHTHLILLCSQRTRDARCGQSAPLLRREFERHLRPLGLYRDLSDQRPGGVGILFISHVGGHKFAANVMVYRQGKEEVGGEASQCIWLARVRPEDCERIVRFTVLEGKVVKPERQLRGGWDRGRGVVSW